MTQTKPYKELMIWGNQTSGWSWRVLFEECRMASGKADSPEEAIAKAREAIDVGF